LISKNLKSRIVSQSIRVVGVFVSSDDLVEALPEQRRYRMANTFLFARVTNALC